MEFLNIFSAHHDCLVVGLLMGTEISEFGPNLCLWQLFKEGDCQGILVDLASPFFQTPIIWAWIDHDFQVIGLLMGT